MKGSHVPIHNRIRLRKERAADDVQMNPARLHQQQAQVVSRDAKLVVALGALELPEVFAQVYPARRLDHACKGEWLGVADLRGEFVFTYFCGAATGTRIAYSAWLAPVLTLNPCRALSPPVE